MKITDSRFPCPYCHEKCTGRVIEVRQTADKRRRRRVCDKCGKRFTTYEICLDNSKYILQEVR